MGSRALMRPDWVLLGVPWGDQVAVFGSVELTAAEMRVEYDDLLDFDFRVARPCPRVFMDVQMRQYVFVLADTYAEAMAKLFEFWQADDQTRKPGPAVGPPLRQLG